MKMNGWRTWEEIEAEARAAGRIDETQLADHREHMSAAQHAHRLADVRRSRGLRQVDVADAMQVSQRRVSAVERGEISQRAHTEIGTISSYLKAVGGRVEVVADFGDERIAIG